MKIALCILTFNELPCLREIFPTIPQPGSAAGYDDLYAIDGGSTDGTLAYFKENHVRVIGQSRRGRGDAFQQAFNTLPHDAFIFFSPDGNEDVKDIPRFKEFLQQGADIVIASRMMKGAVNEEDGQWLRFRKWANNIFNYFANFLFRRQGDYVTDSINGFRAVSKRAAEQCQLDALDYTIEYQMTMRAMQQGLKIVEFPTIEGQRVHGETKAPAIVTGLRFLRCLFREMRRKPRDSPC